MKILFFIIGILLSMQNYCAATSWNVGVGRIYTKPSQVSALVSNGDTVNIDAGIYESDVALWSADNLLLRGIGGKAHLKSNGSSYGKKAIWVIAGNNTIVENIEFSLCVVPDKNGAGIRQEGKNLTVRGCYFHHNETGILAGNISPCTIIIEYSEFGNNGYGDGQSHNLYINHVDTLIFRYNYSHHTLVGHELKSRAHVNYILYNRLSDETTGTASRSIDVPNGGTLVMVGNVIEQGEVSQNSNIIGYGLEGLTNTAPHEVYAVNNTLVNNRSTGNFFNFQAGTVLFKAYNNIVAGNGMLILGTPPTTLDTAANVITTNISACAFLNPASYDYHLSPGSGILLNSGKNPGSVRGFSLVPTMEYIHPASAVSRCSAGVMDIGAYELCLPNAVAEESEIPLGIFPNPAENMLLLALPDEAESSTEIYAFNGKKVLTVKNTRSLDISALPAGVYIVRSRQDAKVLQAVLVKR